MRYSLSLTKQEYSLVKGLIDNIQEIIDEQRIKSFKEFEKLCHSVEERKKIIGDRLFLLRRKAGLSQRQLCSILGVSPQTYSGYESGKYEPSIETLIRLCFVYDVDMDYITGREKLPEHSDNNKIGE